MPFRILPTVMTWANRKKARALEAAMAAPFDPLDDERLRAMLLTCLVLVQAEDDQRAMLIYGSSLPAAEEAELMARYWDEAIELHAAETLLRDTSVRVVGWPEDA